MPDDRLKAELGEQHGQHRGLRRGGGAQRGRKRIDLLEALKTVKGVVVLDRNTVGAVYNDLRSALFGQPQAPVVLGRIIGLGGRDVTHYNVVYAAEEALAAARKGSADRPMDWHFEVIEDEEMLAQVLKR